MGRHDVIIETGTYSLREQLTEHEHDLLDQRMAAMLGVDDLDELEPYDSEEGGLELVPMTSSEGSCWWLSEDGCSGEVDCECGPVTLLEVLHNVPAEQREGVLGAHMRFMGELWNHFWSGQGIVSGASTTINDACVDCLVEGPLHLADLFQSAEDMAAELGEALAAFNVTITLGEPRWDDVPWR